jgi:hypothetical protein
MDFSKLKIQGLSKQDVTLVNDNPEATIEDLMAKGLTPNGETTLRKFVASITPYQPKKKPLVPTAVQAQPMQGVAKRTSGRATVYNERTKLNVTMSAKAAEKVTTKLNKPRQMGKDSRYNQAGQVYRKVG